MTLISSLNFAGLATTLVELKSTAKMQNHLCEVLDCLWGSKSSKSALRREATADAATRKKITALRTAGHEAYVSSFPQLGHTTSTLLLSSPFILFLALIAILGHRKHTRVILSDSLGIFQFFRSVGLFESKGQGGAGIMASQLLMRVFEARLHSNLDADLRILVAKVISDIPYTAENEDSDAGYMWAQLKRGFIDAPSEYLLMKAVSLISERIQMPSVHRDALLPLGEPVAARAGIEKNLQPITINKRLVLAHDSSRLFRTHGKEAYFQMMEDYIVTFLAEVIDYHLTFQQRPNWALYDLPDVKLNFLQLFAVSSSKSPSERLLELHAFIQKNITEFTSLRHNLASTVFAGTEASQGECLDQIGHLFRDLDRMARCDSPAHFELMEQDILRWYTQTADVHIDFLANEASEKESWIKGFKPEADAVVFVVPLAECERLVVEDASVETRWNYSSRFVMLMEHRENLQPTHSHWYKPTLFVQTTAT
ncbi:hypothetical protein PQX77_008762 [Marasmius sp. AFHP31]|nr:hypothetical protein PQX77_008762 [Marasmius sp. AFHP31]